MRKKAVAFVGLVAVGSLLGCGSGSKDAATGPGGTPSAKTASRVDIKRAVDPDAARINRVAQEITVEDLVATRLPDSVKGGLETYPEKRIGPFETSTYKMDATIKSVQHRKDGDFYLVVEGASGKQAVVEVPDPEQCKNSPMYSDIKAAREQLEKRYHPTDDIKNVDDKATIEGVGFYGFKGRPGSGTQGRSARLMPGTGVHFSK